MTDFLNREMKSPYAISDVNFLFMLFRNDYSCANFARIALVSSS